MAASEPTHVYSVLSSTPTPCEVARKRLSLEAGPGVRTVNVRGTPPAEDPPAGPPLAAAGREK